jgi:predicted ATPase
MRNRAYLSEVSLKPSAATHAQDFPFTLPVVRALDRLAMHPNVTFFVGENGSGKSTLLDIANPKRMLDILMER